MRHEQSNETRSPNLTSKAELIKRVERLARLTDAPIVVALDGRSGTGKSTLERDCSQGWWR